MSTIPASPPRRADLDWIRVAAFGLLILYHVCLVYGPWDWHINSSHRFEWVREGALITNPWRLTLLFLVSGCALRLMTRRRTPGEVLRARAARLVPPYLFGMVVLVPPQAWMEAVSKGGWSGTLVDWWVKEFSPAGIAAGVPVNHLWFVLYIAVYSLVAVTLLTRSRPLAWLEARLEWALTGWRTLVIPILYLAIVRQALVHVFGLTNRLEADWYNHAVSLAVFLGGFALVNSAKVWEALEAKRWVALGVAVVALPVLMGFEAHPGGRAFNSVFKDIAYAIDQWATIAAILGFGSRRLRRADGPVLRYLTDSVFPCYLIHQTILVAAIFVAKPWGLPAIGEAGLLTAVTFGGSLLVYEIVRRSGPMRPLWGLKREAAAKSVRSLVAPAGAADAPQAL